MKTSRSNKQNNSASTLVSVLVFSTLVSVGIASVVQSSFDQFQVTRDRRRSREQADMNENLLAWAASKIGQEKFGREAVFSNNDGSLDDRFSGADKENLTVTITPTGVGSSNLFAVTSSIRDRHNKIRSAGALVRKDPPAEVFNHAFCLNNRGLFNHDNINIHGDMRFNWDAHIESAGLLNGHMISAGEFTDRNGIVKPGQTTKSFSGQAGAEGSGMLHPGAEKLKFPSLAKLDRFRKLAVVTGGRMTQGTTNLVIGVHNNPEKPGLFLEGTQAEPVLINGVVVIEGDLVIKGFIGGIGAIYVGGNLYLSGDLIYINGPDFSIRPEVCNPSVRDAWVLQAVDSKKDLVAFMVRESILCGQVNNVEWKRQCYFPEDSGLQFRGSEAGLGRDGIPGTSDDSKPFVQADGTESSWRDIDQDGVVDGNFDFLTHIKLNSARARKILGYPVNKYGTPENYNDYSANRFNRLDGVFYTEHAFGLRSTIADLEIHGAVIAREEAIVFKNSFNLVYDPRIHSRYADDPARFVELHLPCVDPVQVLSTTNQKTETKLSGNYFQ